MATDIACHKLKMAAHLDVRSADEVNADLVLKHYISAAEIKSPIWIYTENIFSPLNISKLCKFSEGR